MLLLPKSTVHVKHTKPEACEQNLPSIGVNQADQCGVDNCAQ